MAWCTAGFDIIYGCCGCEAGAGVVLAALIAVKQYYTKYSLTNNDNSRFQSFWAVYAISRLQVGVFFSDAEREPRRRWPTNARWMHHNAHPGGNGMREQLARFENNV